MKCPFVIKVCTICKRILIANEINFAKDKRSKSGLQSKCKICDKIYREKHVKEIKEYKKQYYKEHKEEKNEKDKQYRKEHKEEIKIKNKKYREEHKKEKIIKDKQYYKENKERILEYQKQYRKENKNKIKEYKKQYYEDNKDEIANYQKQYRENNPEKCFNNNNKRRQLEESQGDGITKEQWLEMMEFFDWKCAYSGKSISNNKNRTIDHIVPLINNGENEIWNLIPMLKACNSSKYTNNMEDWYIQQEFFDIDRLLKIYDWIEYAYNKWGNK